MRDCVRVVHGPPPPNSVIALNVKVAVEGRRDPLNVRHTVERIPMMRIAVYIVKNLKDFGVGPQEGGRFPLEVNVVGRLVENPNSCGLRGPGSKLHGFERDRERRAEAKRGESPKPSETARESRRVVGCVLRYPP